MYSKLYAPLPDTSAYLKRIGAEPCKTPDKEYLDRLIYLHQTHVAFENISIYDQKKKISLAMEDMFRKIVSEHKGGFCFELNGMFGALLRACGYQMWEIKGRVMLEKVYGGHVPPTNHRAEVVVLDGKLYLCDVGFGGPCACKALLIEDGYEETSGRQRFRIERTDEYWWTLGLCTEEGFDPLIQFTLQPQDPVEYESLAFYHSTSPRAKFVQNRVVNLKTENGNKSIMNDTYTCVENGVKTKTVIEDSQMLQQLLQEEFGLNYF